MKENNRVGRWSERVKHSSIYTALYVLFLFFIGKEIQKDPTFRSNDVISWRRQVKEGLTRYL